MGLEARHRSRDITATLSGNGKVLRGIAATVVATCVCCALVAGQRACRRQQADHLLHAFSTQLDAETHWMQGDRGRPVRAPYVDRVVTERVPGATAGACKAVHGTDASEDFARCRSGYDVTRLVREYR